METSWDKWRAVVYSLGVHALAVGLLFVGLLRQPLPIAADAEGPAMEATLVSSQQPSTAVAKAIRAMEQKVTQQDAAPPPQPKPEPAPQNAPQPKQLVPQAQLPKPDTVNQEEVRRAADLAALQKQQQEQDEKHRQEQIDLSRQQEQQDAENRQRLAQQAEVHKQLVEAQRQIKLQEQKLKQIQDLATQNNPPTATAMTTPAVQPPAGGVRGTNLASRYLSAIRAVVNQNWDHENVPERVHCKVHFTQLQGGEVLNVTFPDCPYDAAGQRSVEDALKKTPLPYSGFESVFVREGTIDMCYPEEACK